MDIHRQKIITNAYNQAAEAYAELCFYELYNKPLDKKLYDLFFDRVVNKGKALEIGCGPGEIANYLKMKGLDITGIDISEKMIEIATRLNTHIDFRVGDVFNLDYKSNSIAGIVAPYLIVNFKPEDLPAAFSEMVRVLVTGGQLLIAFHSGNQELEIHDFFVKGNTIPYTYFDSNHVIDMIKNAGFAIIEHINRMPYEGEVTNRTYIFAEKNQK